MGTSEILEQRHFIVPGMNISYFAKRMAEMQLLIESLIRRVEALESRKVGRPKKEDGKQETD
jgi:hypothetical protein